MKRQLKGFLVGMVVAAMLMLLLSFTLIGCGDSKYKLDADSKLTKEDMKILQKNYDDLGRDERTRLITIYSDMTADEMERFKDDFKRLYVEEMERAFSSRDTAEKSFEESFDRKLREKQGKLTPEEVEENKHYKEKAKEFNAKVGDYLAAEGKIQENLDNLKASSGKVQDIMVKGNAANNQFDVKLTIKPLKETTVGEVNNLRIAIVDEVLKAKEVDKVRVELYMGNEYKDNYTFTFGSGWDKTVEP